MEDEELTADYLEALDQEYRAKQVFIEFNGMWALTGPDSREFPINWMLVQIISTVDAQTFMMYVGWLRGFDVSDSLVFRNDSDQPLWIPIIKKSFLAKIISLINKGAQIIYELLTAELNDLPEDDLPSIQCRGDRHQGR